MNGTQSFFSIASSRSGNVSCSMRSVHSMKIPCSSSRQWSTTTFNDDETRHRSTYARHMSKFRRLQQQQQPRESISLPKKYFPDSFVYRRGDHPYGTREYILVRPKPNFDDDSTNNGGDTKSHQQQENISRYPPDSSPTAATIESSLPNEVTVLATIHANNNIVFGANVNTNVARKHETDVVPSILDLCPILLQAAITDCSNEGEQPQALSTLHGLSAWVRQCLDVGSPIQSNVIQALQERMKNPTTEPLEHHLILQSTSAFGRQMLNVDEARQQLECITAIATHTPRAGHSVVGQKTHADGAIAWEALSREYALLDYDNDDTKSILQLSDECLLYRQYTESCELVEIELLADTSPKYLLSAGGAMARFFIM